MKKLNGKTTFITGASAGIGESCAKLFAEAGSNLIITGRREGKLHSIGELLRNEFGVSVLSVAIDVRNYDEMSNLISNLPDEFKKIDILINNAGKALGLGTVQEGDIQDWEEMIDTNIKGLLYTSRLIAPLMIKQGRGFIINVSSIAGRHAYPKGNVYCATKSATKTISEAMAIDLNGTGVRICNIDPGMVETEFSLVRFKGDEERAANVYKSFKALSPDDIADILLFVATRPEHVMIQDIMVTPTAQANAYVVSKK
ncbi:MAG TPA: SDR family NAD(P)-dependent oxidoreductase [Candidatus Kapabacteria bacterium]|nr:SDR family NAD(P)-dependent oxidoreductase [Candidatus Kapabacteria bacterium]